jgi:quercetin dioxygenase-like cupin family protein
MHRAVPLVISILVIAVSSGSVAQEMITPQMTSLRLADVPAANMDDGREIRRVEAATLGVIRVAWPAGTVTEGHNHANELIVVLLEGSLRAMSGNSEVLLSPGELVIFPAYVDHRYEALEDSVTLEAYGPGG